MNGSKSRSRQQAREAGKQQRAVQIAAMSGREKNVWTIIGIVLVALAVFGLVRACSSLHDGGSAGAAKTTPTSSASRLCSEGEKVVQKDFAVAKEGALRDAPKGTASTVQMNVGTEKVDAPLEAGSTVRQLCRAGDWSKVHVLTAPKEFQPLEGWVPTSSLRKVGVTAQGRRIYEAADFDWPAGSKPFRGALLAVMNRIMQDNPACEALDTDNLVANKRGKQTVYSVPCWSEGDLQSFDFTAADATNRRSFAPVSPMGKLDAIAACKQGVLSRAAHPSSVKFPTFDYDFREGENGRTQVLMSAKASNSLNLQLDYDVQCDFNGSELDNLVMSEARPR
ncbi:hypothetical protein ACQR50_03620 [Sphingomonas sp. Xoc002]|uniref:hypothetical protein n=1 Tax=Sphingomonas sp. Xoc002 TaxID=2837624 RepID=UPI003D176A6E